MKSSLVILVLTGCLFEFILTEPSIDSNVCGLNQRKVHCVPCESCVPGPCALICMPGCACVQGYKRKNGVCVPESMCGNRHGRRPKGSPIRRTHN